MRLRIHFQVNGKWDYFDIEGDNSKECRKLILEQEIERSINVYDNNLWVEDLQDRNSIFNGMVNNFQN